MVEGRRIFFPYCLQRQEDGRYIVLNRNYKPIGFVTNEHVDYSSLPIAARIRGLTAAKAKQLSHDGNENLDAIFLYNDATVPTRSAGNMKAYLAKLELLAKLQVE